MRKIFAIAMLIGSLQLHAQDSLLNVVNLSLQNVIDLAINQSSSVKYAQNTYVNYYWRYRNYQATYMPQLMLTGNLPEFSNKQTPVVQSDGSIDFVKVQQLKASADLALNQYVSATGATIYAASDLDWVSDFIQGTNEYSGSPFYIGIDQPVFSYNWMKWHKKTEPLVFESAKRDFIETVEEIALKSTSLFFTYLRIQTNYMLAQNNLKNSKDNLSIAEVRQGLGTISENDFSRIRLSVLNAQKSLSSAEMDLKNADFQLKSYINLDQSSKISLEIPLDMHLFYIDPDEALRESQENKDDVINFQRRLIEADRDLEKAKRDNSLNATLRANYGLSNSADYMTGVYDQPEQQQYVRLRLSVPIMDWGRSSSQVKLAESKRELVLYDVDKDIRDFERGVVVQVEKFNLLEEQLEIANEADKVAENGYKIALKKFQNGEISITDLNIALGEREKAKRDYIRSIENYWESFFYIRILTLYDFELKQKIFYENPMLEGESRL